MKFLHLLAASIAALAFHSRDAQAVVTLDQYRDIVVADNAPAYVQSAARDLQYHLAKISGHDFPIVSGRASAAKDGSHFYVGPGLWPALDAKVAKAAEETWLISPTADGVLLSGDGLNTARTSGVGHAVSLFLEKACGVRWLWPGASGEVIPSNARLPLPEINESGAPTMQRRKLTFGYARYWTADARKELDTWVARTRQGDQLRANFGHSWSHVMPPDKYFAAHPEWYGLVDGKRVPLQLCTSNPALRDEFVKNLLALPENQKLDILSVSANDGYGFCECPLCRAKGEGAKDYHNAAYWDFVNDIAGRVKKLRPDLGIGTFAYTVGREPPEKIAKLPDNVYLSMTTYETQFLRPEGKRDFETFLSGWKSKGVHIVMRSYWGMHYWLDLPVLYPNEISYGIKTASESGMIGAYGETGKNFSTQAPNYYLLTHQLWDPKADPKQILDEFYDSFGAAKAPVRAYFAMLEAADRRAWNAQQDFTGTYVETVILLGQTFTPDLMQKAKTELDEADRLAGADAELKARIAFLRAGWEYTSVMGELLSTYDKLGRTGFPLESFEWEATAQGRRKLLQSAANTDGRDFFQKRLHEPFAYTLEQKDAWLARAWELGQKRVQLLNANRGNFALDEGLYALALEYKIRQWQQTVGQYLGKSDNEIVALDYTKKPSADETVKTEQGQP